MFKLPPDIEHELVKKYPNADILNIIHDTVTLIVNKACFDGSCLIRGFGKFIAFKIYSERSGKDAIRFKFVKTVSFINRIKNDNFLMDHLILQFKKPYTEKKEKKCKAKRHRKITLNKNDVVPIHKIGKERTNYKLATQEILNILEEPEENIE